MDIKDDGIGFTGILTIVLVILKAFGVLKVSWIWVFSPIWIGFILWLIIAAVIIYFMNK